MREIKREILHVDCADGKWLVQFIDTKSGQVIDTENVVVKGGDMAIALPSFERSIAFKATIK